MDFARVAAGMAEQQAIDGEGPGVGILRRCVELHAMFGVESPAGAGGVQPGAQAVEAGGIEPEALRDRRHRQPFEHFVHGESRTGQGQQAQERVRHRRQHRVAIGQRIRDGFAVAEHGAHVGSVLPHVRRQHGDIARFDLRMRFQQVAQAIVQYLHFAQSRMAGMYLQATIVRIEGVAIPVVRRRRAPREQIALHPVQQTRAPRRIGRNVKRLLERGTHGVVAEQQAEEIASGRAVRRQQRILFLAGETRRIGTQAFAHGLQVAPPAFGRRQEIEMQRTSARRAGDHAQHIRRNVLAGEGEQSRRHAGGHVVAPRMEAPEIGMQPRGAMTQAARRPSPQFGLPVVAVFAVIPAQQPIAAPSLVFLECRRQFAGQRPRGDRAIALAEHGLQRREHRFAHRRFVGQQGPQAPAQHGRVADIAAAIAPGFRLLAVRGQGFGDELARRQETQVGGDAMRFGQRLLQPAAHRRLRDQDRVAVEQARLRRRLRQLGGQQGREQFEVVAVMEAEIGGGHAAHHAAADSRAARWRRRGLPAIGKRLLETDAVAHARRQGLGDVDAVEGEHAIGDHRQRMRFDRHF